MLAEQNAKHAFFERQTVLLQSVLFEKCIKMVHKIRAVIIIIKLTILVSILCTPVVVECSRNPRIRPRKTKNADLQSNAVAQSTADNVPCSCAIFLTGQFNKQNRSEPPRGNPAIQLELMQNYPCTAMGNKQCSNRCLEAILKHLPNSQDMICATIDRDCFRERAYLFYQNCAPRWVNTNLSAGREFCCQNDRPVRCAKMAAVIRQSLLAGGNGTMAGRHEDDESDEIDSYEE